MPAQWRSITSRNRAGPNRALPRATAAPRRGRLRRPRSSTSSRSITTRLVPMRSPRRWRAGGRARCSLRRARRADAELHASGRRPSNALLRNYFVEHCVVDHHCAFLGKAGDVAITVLPTNVAVAIELARIEILRRIVVDAADIECKRGVARREIGRCHSKERAGLVDNMINRPRQHEHLMLVAAERQLVIAAKVVALRGGFLTLEPQPCQCQ